MNEKSEILYHYCSVDTFFNIIKTINYGFQTLKNQMTIRNVYFVEKL